MKCSACKGAWHPATGHAHGPMCRLCLRCTQDYIAWIKGQHRRCSTPWRKPPSEGSFDDAARTSIGARRMSFEQLLEDTTHRYAEAFRLLA